MSDPVVTPMSGGDAHAAFRERRVFSSLDGLRCLCILAVIWHHTPYDPSLDAWLPAIRFGFLGVDLFFVISGFLIVTLLLRERDRSGTISMSNFWARRALRIFPLYFGLLAALTVLFLTVRRDGTQASAFFGDLPFLLTYTTNWVTMHSVMAITWSLSAEEQFYALWPPVERWASRAVPWVLGALIALSQVIHFGLIDGAMASIGFGPTEPGMLRETTFTPILLGVAAAHVMHRPSGFAWVWRVLGHRVMPAALLVTIAVTCWFLPDDIRGWGRLLMHVLMVALVMGCVAREDHALERVLTLRPIARIGLLSYGIYLFHLIALDLVGRALSPRFVEVPGLLLAGTVALSILMAELSYRFYEKRWLALKDRFRETPAPLAPEAVPRLQPPS